MEISYFWTINPLEAYPTASGENDVVFTTHYQLHAISTVVNGSTYTARSAGTQELIYQSSSVFTPFNDLTLPQVQGWVENAMGEVQIDKIKMSLSQSINDQITPLIVTLPSPWITGSI